MEVKRVRVSVACDACKKRRGKCAGTSPCDYCSEHNVPCCFSTKSKKRGPASKHPKIETASSTASSASASTSSSTPPSTPSSSIVNRGM
jgi:Fungal Zn(2)-Cys(6) binuclear cluster domain